MGKDKQAIDHDAVHIESLTFKLRDCTIRLRQLAITMRESEDNMMAGAAYDMWLREMQQFEQLSSLIKQMGMGYRLPPIY